MKVSVPEIRFTLEDAHQAADAWNFNCGPASLCVVLGKTPEEIRPHLLEFEKKGYTNPTLMADILIDLGVPFRRSYEGIHEPTIARWPDFGLVRIQWGGPWCKEGVPMAARYRQTHWVAMRKEGNGRKVFDINAMCAAGWISWSEWSTQLVPWLLTKVAPRNDGTWWPTHCWEVES